jgi:hypothetical protein
MTVPLHQALRFRDRHVTKSIGQFIEDGLIQLGWVNSPVNFGATPFTFKEYAPEESGKDIAVNTLAVSVGDPGITEPHEMGQGIWTYPCDVFIDVYAESRELAKSLAGDMHDWIFQHPIIRVQDWTDPLNPLPSDVTVEWEDLEGPLTPNVASSAVDIKKHWKVIRVTAHVYYIPDFY